MKSYEKLFLLGRSILMDALAYGATDQVNLERDMNTIMSRIEDEGLSFLTITLPAFNQGIERSLEEGCVSHGNFQGWKFSKCLPKFLSGFTRQIFDVATGSLLPNPSVEALRCIRQLCCVYKKILVPCKPEKVNKAILGYKATEQSLTVFHEPNLDIFNKISELLWNDVFYGFNPFDTFPKHGPGSTQEKVLGNQKFSNRIWYERLQPFFPYDHFNMVNLDQIDDDTYGMDSAVLVPEDQEQPVRVVPVPKTQKGPRIIAIEPVCMQYAQQALARFICERVSNHWITAGHINFKDQQVNRDLAMVNSVRQELASLDLSEASDRVPLSLVRHMIPNKLLLDSLLACRSRFAQLPNGEILPLSKFASMGSATCFPIEAMYFFTVILTSIFQEDMRPVTLRNIYALSRKVFVYGDDLFVPVNKVAAITETLTNFNCKVNIHKSFWNSKFRESCGLDAFSGEDITPIYLRRMLPSGRKDASSVLSSIATSNLFYEKGFWHTSSYLKDQIEGAIGKLPIVEPTSPGVGWSSFQKNDWRNRSFSRRRYNKLLHRYEIRTYVPTAITKSDVIDSWPALLKCLLNKENLIDDELINVDSKHLTRSSRPGSVAIKSRWTTEY